MYTKEQLEIIVKISTSLHQVLLALELPVGEYYYNKIKEHILLLELDVSHFTTFTPAIFPRNSIYIPSSELTKENTRTQSNKLKKKLLKENILPHECSNCHNTEWMAIPIPLELHHIDGDKTNNTLINIKLLCPNCHSLTPNYRGKNTPISKSRIEKRRINAILKLENKNKNKNKKVFCIDCGKEIYPHKSKRCKHCAGLQQETKISYPSIEELISMIKETSYVAVAKQLGISDNGIRKHLKIRGVNPKTLELSTS